MRASDLLGAEVRTADGRRLGIVHGLRCSMDGASDGPVPAPRIRSLVVGPRSTGAALGYQQQSQRGPWLLRTIIAALHRGTRVVGVGLVDTVDSGTIRLKVQQL